MFIIYMINAQWEERHYKMVEEAEKMFKEGTQGKEIDIFEADLLRTS